jgi:hypothetical protein
MSPFETEPPTGLPNEEEEISPLGVPADEEDDGDPDLPGFPEDGEGDTAG